MVRAKVCGSRCHNAETIHCKCWCCGVFHGANGAYNRKHFQQTFQRLFPEFRNKLESGLIKYKEVTKNVNPKRKMS